MIELIELHRIKCFQTLTVPLRRLTVLTGTNGGGKTTIVHALLLAWLASARKDIDLGRAFGQRLGDASDMLNVGADPSEGIGVTLWLSDASKLVCEFAISERRTQSLIVRSPVSASEVPSQFMDVSFSYLSADRLGPQDVYETTAIDDPNPIGVRGEQVAQILAEEELRPVSMLLRHPESGHGVANSLLRQVEAWLSAIVRPIEVQATWFPNASAASLRFRQPGFLGEWVRPIHAGFGLTATIPIVVAALRTNTPGVLIVENPEAHLHPRGQSEMGRFLARVAAGGTQVVVETHSDHFLNGVRRAVAADKTIAPADVVVHFFEMTTEIEKTSRMRTLSIEENGEIDAWPEYFFDQIERDLGILAAHRRRTK